MQRHPSEADAVLAAAASLRGLMAVARALVEAGRTVDLAGLDQDAGRLCAALACAQGVGAGGVAAVRMELESCLRELDALRAALAEAEGR